MALVIERGDAGEVGGDPKDGVESVGLLPSLRWGAICGGGSFSASTLGGGIGFAGVHELVAHELGDDVDVLGRSVIVARYFPRRSRQRKALLKDSAGRKGGKLTLIDRLESSLATAIKASAKLDLRNAARSKVANVSGVGAVAGSAVIGNAVGAVVGSVVIGTAVGAVAGNVVLGNAVGTIDRGRSRCVVRVARVIRGSVGAVTQVSILA